MSEVAGVLWLVMLGIDGVMETAFPPEDPPPISRIRFTRLGNNGGACGMNPLLAHYGVAVHHPGSVARNRTAAGSGSTRRVGTLLTAEELEALGVADATLAAQAPRVQRELQRFVDLAVYRREHNSPERWWWYLDVIQHVPRPPSATPAGA